MTEKAVRIWVFGAMLGLLGLPSIGSAGSKTGADFLKLPVDAQPTGVGQAYTALANGPAAINWNPAGINRMGRATSAMSLSHQQLFFNSHLEQISFIGAAGDKTSWGFNMVRLSYDDQDARDTSGNVNGSLSSNDMSAGLALAQRVGVFQLGGQFKWIRQDLAGETAQGPALDLGLLSPTPISRLSLGLSARNLGPSMKFVDESFHLPMTLTVGAAYDLNRALKFGADLYTRPYENETAAAFGVEFHAIESFALRAGYLEHLAQAITNNQESESERGDYGSLTGFSGGMGLQLGSIGIDYAFSPFGELGNVHAFTLSAQFGAGNRGPATVYSPQPQPVLVTPAPAPTPSQGSVVPMAPPAGAKISTPEEGSAVLPLNDETISVPGPVTN